MAIFTPRGLKIRLATDLAFTYIARLQPTFTAFQVLKTVEGIELIPSTFAFITGLYLFLNNYSPTDIAIYVGVGAVIGGLITTFGLYVIPFMVRFITGLSYLHGFGIFTIGIIISGLLTIGWKGVVFYFIGRYTASFILFIIDTWQMKMAHKKTGFALTASERNFFNSYRLHASRIGVTTSLELENGELESEKWKLPYMMLEQKWPKVTARFTDN
ncbi:hypothetical protein [Niastella sp. OAS944]|uniref:hypothetical protein n=1 Tax=Niastella sp. OAS944 TaxID=2664089 RepID=UPI00348CFBD8|nr:hypothetical protein [Chitinophagaceae bacterium OAS944]